MSRTYTFNKIPVPSVTTVIDVLDKPALKDWAVKMALIYALEQFKISLPKSIAEIENVFAVAKSEYRTVSDDAKDIGSEIHGLIEKYIKLGKDAVGDIRDEVQNGFLAFLDWEKENGIIWLESEKNVFDPISYLSGGTLDAIAKFTLGKYAGMTSVVDFKSSKGFFDGYEMQIAAYRNFRTKCNGLMGIELDGPFGVYKVDYPIIEINGSGILRLDKYSGLPEYKDFSETYEQDYVAFEHLCRHYYAIKQRRLKGNPNVGENRKRRNVTR